MSFSFNGCRKRVRQAAVLFILCAFPVVAATDDAAYRTAVEKWRQAYEADLKSDSGWLTVSGLFWLHEGANTFGSGPLNDIVLPQGLPTEAGTFVFHGGKTIAHLKPGVAATLGGKPVASVELKPDTASDTIVLGDVKLMVHQSGERYAIRLKDLHSALRKNFKGLSWFPIDASYRVTAKWVPYPRPKTVVMQNIMGDTGTVEIPGYASFTLHGQALRLEGEIDGNDFSVVFRDLTSGQETYGAARFLDTDAPKNGTVVLDFNEAYNPPCAYNPYTTCPLPLPGNRLAVRVLAGEKKYAGAIEH